VRDDSGWVEYTPGDAPLILVAPHGGTLTPPLLPDRACTGCVLVNDLNTQELARVVVATWERRTRTRPHLVVNLLHRRKFDANRELTEASGGDVRLTPSWRAFHAFIDTAKVLVARSRPRGLLIDLHGHGHAVPRLEWGYLLGAGTLRLGDQALVAARSLERSSIARLAAERAATDDGAQLLRGPFSLGGLLAARGVRGVPSPAEPAPLLGEEYFDGGYNTERHGSLGGRSPVDAVQLECHLPGVRDTAENRQRFAEALVDALLVYLARHYGWQP
jgi:N-formylglutamate amidohydrolase